MKGFVIGVVFMLTSAIISAQNYSDAVLGKWISENKRCKVEIYKSGNKYYGKIIWLYEQIDPDTGKPKTDKENPDPKKRNVPLIGLVVLKDFVFEDGYWQDGYVYNSQNGSTYDCDFWLDGNNKLVLKGYWGFLYHTETWTRSN